MKNGSDERQGTQQKHNDSKRGRLHVMDKLDAGHAECAEKGYNMKESRHGRIILKET
jgi:hypothetical protein